MSLWHTGFLFFVYYHHYAQNSKKEYVNDK